MSAVHLASLECQLDCLKILIEKEHVDANLKSQDGWTPLHLVINNTTPELSLNCVEFLICHGADPSRSVSVWLYFDSFFAKAPSIRFST